MLKVKSEGYEVCLPISISESVNDIFYALFQNNPVATLLFDASMHLIEVNQTTFDYFHQKEKSVLGGLFGNVFKCTTVCETNNICGETLKCQNCLIRCSITDSLTSGIGFRNAEVVHEFYLNNRIEKKWFSVNASPIIHSSEIFVVVTMMDITDYKRREETLHQLGITDELTGLFNRRYIFDQLKVQQNVARKSDTPFCLSILDIDNFKQVNDTYGHLVGDNVLSTLAKIIRENIRRADFAGRFGGEEFILILPNCTEKVGREVIGRISNIFQKNKFDNIPNPITFSAGLAEFSDWSNIPADESALFSQTDNLLFNAKAFGKNRIESMVI